MEKSKMSKIKLLLVSIAGAVVLFSGGVATYAAISWDNTGKQNLEQVSRNIDTLTQKSVLKRAA